ncbi:C40 family peptidase [Paenibacillus sp. 1P07SE]|uniref:C40 family peptidase n=1 Tax=Paenibacillus sp. 1P07SE TaxID=3132209 RepID=UPI0039A63717
MKKVILSVLSVVIFFMFSFETVSAGTSKLSKAVNEVEGTPYKWGGTTTKGFDCSGFILYIYKQFDVELPRTSKTQAQVGSAVAKKNLKPGDLVFFDITGKGISHAGIYIGDGKFAHSSSSKGVTVSNLSQSYWAKTYVSARRPVAEKSMSKFI